ncbi:MAG: DNA internalization-related competence protein ComEC/Rec2 [Ignavibacteria bacterium]
MAVIPLLLGIVVSYYTKFNISFLPDWLFLSILISLGIIIALLYPRSSKGEFYLFPYIMLILILGIISFQFRFYKTDPDNVSMKVKGSVNNSVIKGVVTEEPDINDERIRVLIDIKSLNDSVTTGLVLASVYKNKFKEDYPGKITYGDVIELKGKAEELPPQRNPGEFDYGRYLKLHGIDAVFSSYGFENISMIGHETPNLFQAYIIIPVKEHSIETIDALIGGQEGEYLKGLLLGEKSNISKEMKQNFINAGVAHIIAVSGLNVAYVILIIWGVLIFIPLRYSYKIFFTIACLLFYMDLTGNTPSIVRAVIMASIFLIAQIAERKPNSYNIISFAALVILVIDPRQLFDAGFILSFSALLSLVIIYPIFNKWLNSINWYCSLDGSKYTVKAFKGIVSLFMGTFAAQLGTLPVTALMFKKVSIVSLAANLFAIPLSNISLAVGFIMVLVSPVSMWAASVFASVNSLLLYFQIWLIEICAKWDYSFVETYFVDSMMFVVYYIILVLLLSVSVKNYRSRLIIILLLVLNFAVWKDVSSKTTEAEITFLYTGSSNSTLIKMPEGTSVMINAGTSNEKYNSAQRTVIPYLKRGSIENIDLLILNSLDKNEFRNLLYLVSNFNLSKIMIPVNYKKVMETGNFIKNFDNTRVDYVTESRIINQKGNFRIYIYYDSLYKGSSMMTQFLYGDQSFVFNDALTPEDNICNSIYLNKLDLSMQVLRVPGSGSFTNTPVEFITDADPEYIVIGETVTGRKKMNSEIFSSSLNEFGYNILNVGKEGAVILKTNGDFTSRVVWR